MAPFWFVWGARVLRGLGGCFEVVCGEFARVLVRAFLEGVYAGESVVPGVGGKCAGVLAGNVL